MQLYNAISVEQMDLMYVNDFGQVEVRFFWITFYNLDLSKIISKTN